MPATDMFWLIWLARLSCHLLAKIYAHANDMWLIGLKMADQLIEEENIYRRCRSASFDSQNDAVLALSAAGHRISHGSIKDYERGATIPSAKTVKAMAQVYKTPELKWLHCSEMCELGHDIARMSEDFASEDIYKTYFDLAGAFNKIREIEFRLHSIISDDSVAEDEALALDEIIDVLDEVTESAVEIKVWAEKRRGCI